MRGEHAEQQGVIYGYSEAYKVVKVRIYGKWERFTTCWAIAVVVVCVALLIPLWNPRKRGDQHRYSGRQSITHRTG